MNLKKHTKPLSQATVGDLTDHKCGNCGLFLMLEEVDLDENVAWLSCPAFISSGGANDEHSSYSVKLADTGYQEGDPITTAFPQDISAGEATRKRADRKRIFPPQDFSPPPGAGKR